MSRRTVAKKGTLQKVLDRKKKYDEAAINYLIYCCLNKHRLSEIGKMALRSRN